MEMTLKEMRANFFDQAAVVGRVSAAVAQQLSKFGAFVMTRARQSIRTRKKVSEPGTPPTNRTGKLKYGIFFAFDPATESVVMGPTKFGGTISNTALPALEYGGESVIYRGRGRTENVLIAPRPFMQPAFDSELRQLPSLLQNSVK